jgi:transposase
LADRDKRKRRSYSTAFKRRVVAETLEPGAPVAGVARRHGLNANMVFLWRRDPRFGPGQDAAMFLPVEIKPVETPSTPEPARTCGAGEIKIALASGHRLTLCGAFDVDTVLSLVSGLSAS